MTHVSFVRPDAWADLPAFAKSEPTNPENCLNGRCAWLSDTQIELSTAGQKWLSRTIYEVTSPEGLQAAGTFEADFDPSFQQLALHHLRVIRDGLVREIDPRTGLQLLRRERDLERAIFDGRITAHLTIPDVRVGDIIDCCFSIVGANPVLDGKFSAEFRLNWGCWVAETRVRLVTPSDRALVFQLHNEAPEALIEQIDADRIVRI